MVRCTWLAFSPAEPGFLQPFLLKYLAISGQSGHSAWTSESTVFHHYADSVSEGRIQLELWSVTDCFCPYLGKDMGNSSCSFSFKVKLKVK